MATLLTRLDRDRFEPYLALVERKGRYLEDLPGDVPVTDLGGRGPLAFLRLVRLIRRLRPDVVFSSLTFYNTLVLLLRPLVPGDVRFVVRENSMPRVHVPTMPYGWLRWRLYAPAHRKADRIVCQCPEMAGDVAAAGVSRERLVVIPNPVDLERIRRALEGADSPYTGGGPRLVAAGRLVPAKGFDLLLEAFSRVHATHPDAVLHLLGTGPQEAALRRQMDALGMSGWVRFEDFQANPFPWFRHADLFVQPSRYEGFPNVVVEALACGTPVVTFDCPGGTAVVDGENGWKVPVGDVEALAERIGKALDGPRPDRDRVARSVARHEAGAVVARFEELFAELASEKQT